MSNQSIPPVSQAVPPVDDVALKFQAVIAEYSPLRDEISGRSRDQLVCVTASLVGIGALLSTVATDPAKFSGLLVVAPWLPVVVIIAYFLLRFRGDTALPQALEYSFVGLGVFLLAALLFSWRRAFGLT
jgi:hypothetical protein